MGAKPSSETSSDMSFVEEGAQKEQGSEDKIKGLTRLMNAETRRDKELKKDQYDFTKENMQLLKHLFKKMDPTVMKTSSNAIHGEVQLSFKYEATKELLLVKVIKCRDLLAKDLRGKSADPYVKLFKYPVKDAQTVLMTQVTKKSLNPAYHEIFTIPLSDHELQDGSLVVQVWDQDIMEKDDFIGEVVIPLSSFDFSLDPVHTAWYILKSESDLDISGDVEVTLSYELPSNLLVTLHRGNNLTNHYDGDGKPNPFVKLQVPGVKDVQESEIKYGTVNPEWEQTFKFDIHPEEFKERYIILHVVDYDDAGTNDSLGQVIIDLSGFDPEVGYHGSFALSDLKNSERLRAKWFQKAAVQEFREALLAHASHRQPKFLFQQHSGSKVIRVSSRKARTEAKLHIVNGIPVN